MNEFQVAKEVFLSMVKWFLVVLLLNNLIWATVFFVGTSSITSETIQDGVSNNQEVSYGK